MAPPVPAGSKSSKSSARKGLESPWPKLWNALVALMCCWCCCTKRRRDKERTGKGKSGPSRSARDATDYVELALGALAEGAPAPSGSNCFFLRMQLGLEDSIVAGADKGVALKGTTPSKSGQWTGQSVFLPMPPGLVAQVVPGASRESSSSPDVGGMIVQIDLLETAAPSGRAIPASILADTEGCAASRVATATLRLDDLLSDLNKNEGKMQLSLSLRDLEGENMAELPIELTVDCLVAAVAPLSAKNVPQVSSSLASAVGKTVGLPPRKAVASLFDCKTGEANIKLLVDICQGPVKKVALLRGSHDRYLQVYNVGRTEASGGNSGWHLGWWPSKEDAAKKPPLGAIPIFRITAVSADSSNRQYFVVRFMTDSRDKKNLVAAPQDRDRDVWVEALNLLIQALRSQRGTRSIGNSGSSGSSSSRARNAAGSLASEKTPLLTAGETVDPSTSQAEEAKSSETAPAVGFAADTICDSPSSSRVTSARVPSARMDGSNMDSARA